MNSTSKDDYYKILELEKNATPEEIRKAYKRLAFKYHPDKNPNNKEEAEKKFKQIYEAYSILSNENGKIKYDSLIEKNIQKFDAYEFYSKFFKQANDEDEYGYFKNEEKNDVVDLRFQHIEDILKNLNQETGFTKENFDNNYDDEDFF